jgi:quinol-cytochrome oxidoreductase complex cytochrome b subunit
VNSKPPKPDRGILIEFLEWAGLFGFIYGPLDRRLSVREAFDRAQHRLVPRVSWWGCFGGISFFLFLLLAGTGVLLMFFYVPSDPQAYMSIRLLVGAVPFGWMLRAIHHWAAHLILVSLMLHSVRVFYTGAYRKPRDLNWVIGGGLFFIVVCFFLTGNLLPWNQSAYWTAVYWTEVMGKLPIIGQWSMNFLRGGHTVTGATLTRFYAFHVAILPAACTFLIFIHFVIIRKLGISEPL